MKIVYFQAYKNKNQGFLAERYDFFLSYLSCNHTLSSCLMFFQAVFQVFPGLLPDVAVKNTGFIGLLFEKYVPLRFGNISGLKWAFPK